MSKNAFVDHLLNLTKTEAVIVLDHISSNHKKPVTYDHEVELESNSICYFRKTA